MERARVFRMSDRSWWWALPAFSLAILAIPSRSGPDFALAIGWSILMVLIAWHAMSYRVEVSDGALLLKIRPFTTRVELTNIRSAAIVGAHKVGLSLRAFRTIRPIFLPFGRAFEIELEQAIGGTSWWMAFPIHKWLLLRVEREDEFLAILEAAGVQVRREAA